MSAYNPPLFNLPIFDSQAFRNVNTDEFLEFPTAQGVETFPNGLIGNVSGNATSASTITTQTSNEAVTHYLNFSNSSATGVGIVQKNSAITCFPSTGTIGATTFVGDLSGNAVTATRATNIAGGLIGAIPYQSAINTTALLANISTNANMVLCSTGAAVPSWRADCSNFSAVDTSNGTDTTKTIVAGDLYKLHLYRVSTTVTMPASATNLAYIRFSIRGSNLTLIIRGSGATAADNIVTLTTANAATGNGSAGVTLMYNTGPANYIGWHIVQ